MRSFVFLVCTGRKGKDCYLFGYKGFMEDSWVDFEYENRNEIEE